MADPLTRFHETWLGLAQPYEGLVVSIPVLVDAQIGPSSDGAAYEAFRALAVASVGVGKTERRVVRDLPAFYEKVLGYRDDSFAPPAESHSLYVAEGPETLRPSWILPSRENGTADGARPEALGMEVGADVSLDKPDVSSAWIYPPTAKLERLLRHTRVPIGLLTNGRELRIVYAPEGESAGHITFRFDDLVKGDGKPLFDAMRALVAYRCFYGARKGESLRELCEASRTRQLDVTDALAKQVQGALEVLVAGFGKGEERDKLGALAAAREDGTLTRGLLTLLLRLVFLLYAEDRGLLPTEHPLFAEAYSLFGLFARLSADRQAFPDTMAQRFGAYGELVALFRAVFFGVKVGDSRSSQPFVLPERRGELFDPGRFPFLEGWLAGAAPTVDEEARSDVRVPTVDDGTVLTVLEKLIVFEGQRLSYATLDVEQIGSVYEGLMGFDVKLTESPCVRIGPSRAWVSAFEMWEKPARERAKWLQEETGLAKAQAQKIADAFSEAKDERAGMEVLEGYRVKGTELMPAGSLILQPGPERRRTSSHYTPRSLSAPIVRRTLEPLLKVLGEEPTAEQILSLKICDPAMGSGAFLVEACRVLGSEVEAAWRREATKQGRSRSSAPPASQLQAPEVATSGAWSPSSGDVADLTLEARRRVAETCLYGVDKNPEAVTLAKLSLWLVTLAKDKPFSFLDHCLKSGDSLVGLSMAQIEAFSYAPVEQAKADEKPGKGKRKKSDPLPGQLTLFTGLIEGELREAISLRHRLEKLSEVSTAEAAAEKAWLARDADDALVRVKRIADCIVGAFFAHAKDKDRVAELGRRKTHVEDWIARKAHDDAPTEEILEWQRGLHEKVNVFHWPLEFPEVFWPGRRDPLDGGRTGEPACFDAFVGNPPFMGKNGIAAMGREFVDWLPNVHPGSHGNADYSAHFFRRADALLGRHGTIGIIATNTILQGDTRATGIAHLLAGGAEVYDVQENLQWPGAAAVTVTILNIKKGLTSPPIVGQLAATIGAITVSATGTLTTLNSSRSTQSLSANAGLAYAGSYVLGKGFMLTPEQRSVLVTQDRKNAERIFEFLGGEEVNTSSTQSPDRYVISFGTMSEAEAEVWPELLAIVREKVKPERDKNNRESRRRHWWRFGEVAPALYRSLVPLKRCLVTSSIAKHRVFAFSHTQRVFSHNVTVLAFGGSSQFGVVQSRIHGLWARLLSSSLEEREGYRPSDCFVTFPFPKPDPRTEIATVESAGEAFYTRRAAYMVEENVGLTITYNRLKDPANDTPEILELRALTEAMDRAVLEAYGWADLEVPPYCALTEDDKAKQKAFADAVIDRLYALNSMRAKEEARAGAGSTKKGKGRKAEG